MEKLESINAGLNAPDPGGCLVKSTWKCRVLLNPVYLDARIHPLHSGDDRTHREGKSVVNRQPTLVRKSTCPNISRTGSKNESTAKADLVVSPSSAHAPIRQELDSTKSFFESTSKERGRYFNSKSWGKKQNCADERTLFTLLATPKTRKIINIISPALPCPPLHSSIYTTHHTIRAR